MDARNKTSLLLIPISILLLSVLNIWQFVSGKIDFSSLFGSPPISVVPTVADVYNCGHEYTVQLLSIDPLIMYMENFLKETEVQYLLDLKKDDFETSEVYDENLKSVIDTRYRNSRSAMVPRDDIVGVCLSRRLKSLLGNVQHIETELIQIVKYEPGEEFRIHMDWFDKPRNRTYNPDMPYRPYNRLASIFAYLEDSCTGGETYFPNVEGVSTVADGDKFARTEAGTGLLVRPRRRNAVFWNNLLANGTGDRRVAHAGLPVHSGTKIGINIFSHYYFDAPMLGGDEE